MSDVPSDRNERLVKLLGEQCKRFADDPIVRKVMRHHDIRRDFDGLADCITGGMDAVGGLDPSETVIMASEAHYEKLAREIIEYARLHPEDAPSDLAKLLPLMELVPYGRTDAFKKRMRRAGYKVEI